MQSSSFKADDNEPGFGKFAAQCRDDFFSADLGKFQSTSETSG
jgi:hypothetical protein